MEEKKLSRKVRYTRSVIRETLYAMLQEMPLHDITVKELCARADINRATFYTHYANCEDLLRACEEEAAQQYILAMRHDPSQSDTLLKDAQRLFDTVAANKGIIIWLFSPWCTGHGLRLIEQRVFSHCGVYWQQQGLSKDEVERYVSFQLSGSAAFLRTWMLSGFADEDTVVRKQYLALVTASMQYIYSHSPSQEHAAPPRNK